jgi:hypothetical protein
MLNVGKKFGEHLREDIQYWDDRMGPDASYYRVSGRDPSRNLKTALKAQSVSIMIDAYLTPDSNFLKEMRFYFQMI